MFLGEVEVSAWDEEEVDGWGGIDGVGGDDRGVQLEGRVDDGAVWADVFVWGAGVYGADFVGDYGEGHGPGDGHLWGG